MCILSVMAIALVMPSCKLYEGSMLDGKWLCLEQQNTQATLFIFNSDSKKGNISTYHYNTKWIEDSRKQFSYSFSEAIGFLTINYGLSIEELNVQTLSRDVMHIDMNGVNKKFVKVNSSDIEKAVQEVLGGSNSDNGGNSGLEPSVPTGTDYAPDNNNIRHHHFSIDTDTQDLEIYFAGQYSVDTDYKSTLNGDNVLAEYYHKETNIAQIKYGKNNKETITLYFMNNKGGTAIYGEEVGTFTFEKYK